MTPLDESQASTDTVGAGGNNGVGDAGSHDVPMRTIEYGAKKATKFCKREWSKDGILRMEGMMGLRSHVKRHVKSSLYDSFFYLDRIQRPTVDEQKEEMEVYLSYLNKGAKEYALTDKKKESHIRLLISCCMEADWEFAAEKCKEALIKICLEGDVWGKCAPKALESNISKHSSNPAIKGGMDPVTLCADVLDQIGMDVSLLCKKYWRHKDAICAKFVEYLLRKDRYHARRVALIGLDIFPVSSLVAAKAIEAVDDNDDDENVMLKVWCAMYATHLDTKYYEMARASVFWSRMWAQNLAALLAAQGLFDEELEVLVDAGLDDEMLAAFVHDGTLRAAIKYKERMTSDHPDLYYEMCNRLADDILDRRRDLGADSDERKPAPEDWRQNNDDIQTCLQIMKGIPEHGVQFKEFCSELLCDSDIDADLARIIRDVSGVADT